MERLALITSLVLHAFVIFLTYASIGSIFSPKLKDSGHTVFDYVAIDSKSKAPVLSNNTNYKASKQKSLPQNKSDLKDLKNQPLEAPKPSEKRPSKQTDAPKKDKRKKDESIPINKKHKVLTTKTPKLQQKNNKDEKKKDNKADKAIVNLRQTKKGPKTPSTAVQKSLGSLIDNAMTDALNSDTGVNAEEVVEALTASQIDLIRQQIRKCWHFPAGLKNAEDLIVDIKMELDSSGYVTKAEIVDSSRMETDSNFKIAAENAYRAVLDPQCNPLPLPPEKYEEWKELELSFNPKEMFS